MLDKYFEELKKYVDRGILVPISAKEMSEYKGPVKYISHHAAVEKDSPTTPFRIVDSGGKSLNYCLTQRTKFTEKYVGCFGPFPLLRDSHGL